MQIDQFSSFLEGRCSRDGLLDYNTVYCDEFG